MVPLRPQDLVYTLFGEYLIHRPGPVWVGSLIALLTPFDLSEGAVRTVLSRMARKGWLRSRRRGRWGHYDLSARGQRLLEEGAARIFHPNWDRPWNGRWFLIAYSIPEDRRHLRDRLRDRLAWLGFGSLGNGLWISPHDVEAEVHEVAAGLDVEDHIECFRAESAAFTDTNRLVKRCWDLDSVNARYQTFIGRWAPAFHRCREGLKDRRITDEECYVERFRLIHEYREFPLLDPFLPRAMLPEDWGGERAAELVQQLHDLLAEPANRHVDEVLSRAPASTAGRAAGGSAAARGYVRGTTTHSHLVSEG